jgi:Tir chaperone protein (CesT) family
MSFEIFKASLTKFGELIGLSDLAPDDQGYCLLQIDDHLVHLQHDAETDNILTFTHFGPADIDRTQATYEALLEANHFWLQTRGATLSVQPGTGDIYLAANFPAERCGESSVAGDNFQTFLQDFVQAADDWLEQLKDLAENAPINDSSVDKDFDLGVSEGPGEETASEGIRI